MHGDKKERKRKEGVGGWVGGLQMEAHTYKETV